jgi:hypothetical protein
MNQASPKAKRGGAGAVMKTSAIAAFFGLAAVSVTAAADQPPYPFNIERSVPSGAVFSATKGDVFYSEKSAGRPGVFVEQTARAEGWPITIEPDDRLSKISSSLTDRSFWGNKQQKVDLYCPDKYGDFAKSAARIEGYPTVCLVDTDQDQTFDSFVNGVSFSPMGMGYLTIRNEAEKMTPVRYVTRTYYPDAGKEALIELRYEGVKGDVVKLTVIARSADSPAPVYEKQIEVARTEMAGIVIEHPFLGSPGFRRSMGHDRPPPPPVPEGAKPRPAPQPPRPIPTMTITLAKADAKSISGTIVSTYPDWVWQRTQCRPGRMPLGKGEKRVEPPPPEPELTTCETATWRDGDTLVTTSPALLTPGAPGTVRTTIEGTTPKRDPKEP